MFFVLSVNVDALSEEWNLSFTGNSGIKNATIIDSKLHFLKDDKLYVISDEGIIDKSVTLEDSEYLVKFDNWHFYNDNSIISLYNAGTYRRIVLNDFDGKTISELKFSYRNYLRHDYVNVTDEYYYVIDVSSYGVILKIDRETSECQEYYIRNLSSDELKSFMGDYYYVYEKIMNDTSKEYSDFKIYNDKIYLKYVDENSKYGYEIYNGSELIINEIIGNNELFDISLSDEYYSIVINGDNIVLKNIKYDKTEIRSENIETNFSSVNNVQLITDQNKNYLLFDCNDNTINYVALVYTDNNYYDITIKNNSDGEVKLDKTIVLPGDIVTLNITPKDNYQISDIIVKTSDGEIVKVEGNKFVMPNKSVIVEVQYELIEGDNIENSEIEDNGNNPNTMDKIIIAFVIMSLVLIIKFLFRKKVEI